MKKKIGRPLIIDELVLLKLEEVFSLGGTDKEACIYADISPATLYKYQTNHPDFVERKELLRQQPILKARRTINKALEEDANTARWYVERRDDDFKQKSESKVIQEKSYRLDDSELQKTAEQLAELQKHESNPNTGSA